MSGKLSHAYLFVGPRGSGKTSTARIMAQVINCEKNSNLDKGFQEACGVCESCKMLMSGGGVDVIEIDAASNGLVDDIRDLRDKVRLAPIQLKKKIYIIDEVHMVSTSGFNALLKTLEEPPSHAVFILCTTEAHKVPETIISRCSKVSFTRATISEMMEALQRVIDAEKLSVSGEAMAAIAEVADGSFREGHKVLEQLAGFGGEINEELVKKTLGVIGRSSVKKIIGNVLNKQSDSIVESFLEMERQGSKAGIVLSSLLGFLKVEVENGVKQNVSVTKYIEIINALIDVAEKIKFSPDPLLPLEMALLSMALKSDGGLSQPTIIPVDTIKKEVTGTVGQNVSSPVVIQPEVLVAEAGVNVEVSPSEDRVVSLEKIKTEWTKFLEEFAVTNGSLAGMLRNSMPLELRGSSLTLSVRSRFQQDMLERDVKKKVIEQEMAKIWGHTTYKTILNEGMPRTEVSEEDINVVSVGDKSVDVLSSAMSVAEEIFGS